MNTTGSSVAKGIEAAAGARVATHAGVVASAGAATGIGAAASCEVAAGIGTGAGAATTTGVGAVAGIWARGGMRTPLAYLERTATRLPRKVAVADERGTCTFAELLGRSERAAGALIALIGPSPDAGESHAGAPGRSTARAPFPVIIFMEKRIEALVAFFATLMAGGFYVPIDPAAPIERAGSIARTLARAGADPRAGSTIVITDASARSAAEAAFPSSTILTIQELERAPADRARLEHRARRLVDTDPAYVLFTSGSTGTPKGVAVSHRAICGFIDGFVETFGIREDDVLGNQAPLDFDVSVKDIYSALATGATVALLPRRLFSAPAHLVEAISAYRVTVMIWAVAALCLVSSLHGLDIADLSRVRLVMFSGEVMPAKHLNRWLAHLPRATFVNLYGPTEVTCNCLYHVVDRARPYPHGLPLGDALPNRLVLVLDENLQPVFGAGMGELFVGGPDIARGYYGDAERTAAAFVQNPLEEALPGTVYRTGDLVRIDEAGELYFSGRTDNQIKHQGHRIELEEIDAAFEAQEGVERCRCSYDAHLKRIYACYEGTGDPDELRRAVARRLPAPMTPACIVRVDQMPLTKNGKVDRAALLRIAKSAPSR